MTVLHPMGIHSEHQDCSLSEKSKLFLMKFDCNLIFYQHLLKVTGLMKIT